MGLPFFDAIISVRERSENEILSLLRQRTVG